ncbi:hypothetical protein AAHB33_00215 [Paenarthrobacter sp. S56]|uniref:hypothetical protein n=1 Tax=Paenarthrobacter sp. S56 TaxID=3138179 RepID=UPI00321B9AAA
MVLATAATTFVLRRKLTHGRGPEPDTIFWDLFAGSAVILPAILVPAVQWPPAGLVMVALAGTTAAGTLVAAGKVERVLAGRPGRRSGFASDSARHERILAQWRRYELDPAQTIDYPAMTDVRAAETAALAKAMREAERCRVTAGTDYRAAVEHLALALSEAERAAGVPQNPVVGPALRPKAGI